jgi:hypothetical protein
VVVFARQANGSAMRAIMDVSPQNCIMVVVVVVVVLLACARSCGNNLQGPSQQRKKYPVEMNEFGSL